MKQFCFTINSFPLKSLILSFQLLFGIFLNSSNAQTISAGNDTTICAGNSLSLTAVATGVNATTSYTISSILHAPPVPPATGTASNLSDDAVGGPYPIGFTFCFFGNIYTQFYIGSNGWISFSPGQPATYTTQPIPNTSAAVPKNCIMGPWEDWDPGLCSVGGCIRYQTIGTAPNRIMVVSWNVVPMFLCNATLGTFEIAIYESSNIIENHLTLKPNCPGWAGGTGVQGLHNASGTVAYAVAGRNSTIWVTGTEATRYTPAGTPTGIQWYNGATLLGNSASVTVSPAATTTYTAQATLCNGVVISDNKVITVSTPPTLTVNTTNTACGASTGSASVNVAGGTGPFTYNWVPSGGTGSTASNLNAGTYIVTVNDAIGCTQTDTAIVGSTGGLSASVTSTTHVSCNGGNNGSATITSSGGTPPYAYSWLPSGGSAGTATGLTAGTYTVTVNDAGGCDYTTSITITQPSAIVAPITWTNITCQGENDGSAFVTPSGGISPYTYTWAPSGGTGDTASNLSALTYTVTVTDGNNCNKTNSVTIDEPAAITLVTSKTISCKSDSNSATVSVTGGTMPYTYAWSPGGETGPTTAGISAGTYTVVVTDANDCTSTAIHLLNVLPNPVAGFVMTPPQVAPLSDPLILFTDQSTGSVQWLWNFDDILKSSSTLKDPSFAYSDTGSYKVTLKVTSSDGCTDTTYQTIYIESEYAFYIPNAFSPNGDGLNDFFAPKGTGIGLGDNFEMAIYNRWGEKIYYTTDINKPWDGKLKEGSEEIVKLEVYVYKIWVTDYRNRTHYYIGNITIK